MSTSSYDQLTKEQLVELLLERDRDTESNPHHKKYGLIWEEKPEQFEADSIGRIPVLQRDAGKCIFTSPDRPTHVLIQGDNYHALKVLTYTHERSVDVIYIDPPYNTGNKDFKYNDRFVDKDDGYRHSKWLSFMAKRLRLAKSLLKDTGVLLISIDDNEVSQLRLLCDELLGEAAFIADLIWRSKTTGGHDAINVNVVHEHILVYGVRTKLQTLLQNIDSGTEYPEIDLATGRRFKWDSLWTVSHGYTANCDYPIQAPDGSEIYPWMCHKSKEKVKGIARWYWSKETYIENSAQLSIKKARDGAWKVYKRVYGGSGVPLKSILENVGGTSEGKAQLEGIFHRKVFDNPKPLSLMRALLERISKRDALVVDFFAGSGTTAHAVLELNARDGGSRQCIVVTNDEGYFVDERKGAEAGGICTNVTYPRIRKVISGYLDDKGVAIPGLNENLAFFTTEFVEDRALERYRRELSARSAEMLCLRESCYQEEAKTDKRWRSFTDGKGKRLVVVSDEFAATELIPLLKADKRETVVYVFRFGDDEDPANEYDGEGLEHVTAKPVPDSLLALHRRIQKQEVKAV